MGTPVVSAEAAPLLEMLLYYLPLACRMSQMIITSRYTFPLPVERRDLVEERLEFIGLTSFRGADEQKKISALQCINEYPDPTARRKVIEAGQGNPRLMEALDSFLGMEKDLNIESLLERIKGKKEEFVQELVLREIMKSQSEDFQKVMQLPAVYRLPIKGGGIELVCGDRESWESFVDLGVRLSLMEEDKEREIAYYWVTPLLRKEIFQELTENERKKCHQAAVEYYYNVLSQAERYNSLHAFELIEHALKCGIEHAAIEEGSRFLSHLRGSLAYGEALPKEEYILSHVSPTKDKDFSKFLTELGQVLKDMGRLEKAIECYTQALSINKETYGEEHPDVAEILNNLGTAWDTLGNPEKAIEYYEQALSIDMKVLGERHPEVAIRLGNLGVAWGSLKKPEKAIEYHEKALSITKEAYGEQHPHVAISLNNLGSAWDTLGNPEKAIEYYEQALSIDMKVYGERHPDVAVRLNNLGACWKTLGNPRKAIEYYMQALSIMVEIYGEKHPNVAVTLNNMGVAWIAIGNLKKAVGYVERAYHIFQESYGDEHPHTKIVKERLDALNDKLK